MRATRYSVLKRRRAEWRAELRKPKPKYPKKTIRATLAALNEEMLKCLVERSP